jgi:hypothetical protein
MGFEVTFSAYGVSFFQRFWFWVSSAGVGVKLSVSADTRDPVPTLSQSLNIFSAFSHCHTRDSTRNIIVVMDYFVMKYVEYSLTAQR